MKNINVKKTCIENFGPYKDETSLDFSTNGLTVISGKNGSGKTFLIDSIPYGLFGIMSKGLKGDDVINDEVLKNCHTKEVFAIDDIDYEINVYRKHHTFSNSVILESSDGFKLNGRKDVTKFIEENIYPYKVFVNTVFFPQDREKDAEFLSKYGDGDAHQKEIFNMLLNLSEYKTYRKNVSSSRNNLEDMKTKLDNSILSSRETYKNLSSELKLAKVNKDNFDKDKKSEVKEMEDKLNKLKEVKNDFESKLKKHNIADYNEQIKNIDIDVKVTKINIINLNETLEIEEKKIGSEVLNIFLNYNSDLHIIETFMCDIYSGINKCIEEQFLINILDVSKTESSIEKTLSTIQTTFEALNNSIGDNKNKCVNYQKHLKKKISTCPLCKQNIGNLGRKEIEKDLESTLLKIDSDIISSCEMKDEISKIEENLNVIRKDKKLLNENKDNIKDKTKEYIEDINKLIYDNLSEIEKYEIEIVNCRTEYLKSNTIQYIKEHEDKIKEWNTKKEKINEHMSKIEKVIEKKNEIVNSINQLQGSIKTKRESKFDNNIIKNIERSMIRIKNDAIKNKNNIEAFDNEIEILNFFDIACSNKGIPGMLVDDAIPYLNKRVVYYLDKLSNNRLSVSFDTQSVTGKGEMREKFSVNVFDHSTKANSKKKISTGQWKLINISSMLALQDYNEYIQGISFNLRVFDEVFDSLDDSNISNVVNLLREMSKEKRILVISHRHVSYLDADENISL